MMMDQTESLGLHDWMDPVNELLFDMREGGATALDVSGFLLTRGVVELAMDGLSLGDAEVRCYGMLRAILSKVYGHNELIAQGSA